VLECPYDQATDSFVPPPDADPWTDCAAALQNGLSGQACGANFTCGRVASACCVEVASCGILYPGLPSEPPPEPSQHLIRLQVCNPDCEKLLADDGVVANDCASAYIQSRQPDGVAAIGRHCEGDFVCMNGVDIRGQGVTRGIEVPDDGIVFCQGGLVLGRGVGLQPPALQREL
jgi:hypothetical protein